MELNEHEKRQAERRLGPPDPKIRRIYFAQEAMHSVALEGLAVSAAARADIQEYVDGLIDSEELLDRALARWKDKQ